MNQNSLSNMQLYPAPTQGAPYLNKGKKYLFSVMILVGIVMVCELVSWMFLVKFFPNHEIVRQVLLGNNTEQIKHAMNSMGQAYLLYIPSPGFTRGGVIQHNQDGYRGPAIPRGRSSGKLRVLFLGGSTTYGMGVERPEEAYPAVVGQILEQRLEDRFDGVEVINGGVMFGTTAEIMTHYLFKYRYYRPDIIVINTGGNDAMGSAMKTYHPDYSHWRKPLPMALALSPSVRWIMHSRTLAFIAIRMFYANLTKSAYFYHEEDIQPPAAWYVKTANDADENNQIPEEDLAFKRNLSTIIREVKADGVKVLLVPFRVNPNPNSLGYEEEAHDDIVRNEGILKQLARDHDVNFAPFPAQVISPEDWVDSCHLNVAGARDKAHHVVEYLLPIINPMVAKKNVPGPVGS